LDRSTKILIGGIFAGALTYGVGELNTHRLEEKVRQLQQTCIAEQKAEGKNQGALSALASMFTGKPTCDPVELAASNSYSGVQAELAAAERDRQGWSSWPPIAAMAVAIVSCLPWLWYFILRRIRELREAIVGK
jgi:hypothetical protein